MNVAPRVTLLVGLILTGRTAAAAPGPAPAPPPAAAVSAPPDPAGLISAADAAIDAGQLDQALALYARVASEFPTSREAAEARRAAKILRARAAALSFAPPSPGATAPAAADGDTVLRLDPYSRRTAERLRLTTWEKLDFGVTSFLYGLSLGTSFALTLDDGNQAMTPIAIGALVYTLGAVGYLNAGNPDRGDLPLALAITSYIPTSTLLLSNLFFPHADSKDTGIAVTVAGLAAVPIALFATSRLNLDPGDTQVVRDAGFWGLVLGTAGSLGFQYETFESYGYSYKRDPSNRTIATWGAVGLFGGLGLGALAAAHSELSLERIRVTTWGGYGGGLLGALLVAGGRGDDHDVFRGITIGAALGLTVTFLTTGGLDGIPPETAVISRLLPRGVVPTVVAAPGLDPGSAPAPVLGFAGVLP
jgi:hypothetical protein